MSDSSPVTLLQALEPYYSALLFGGLLFTILYTLNCVFVVRSLKGSYRNRYWNIGILHYVIYFFWTFDTIQFVLLVHSVDYYLVRNAGDVFQLARPLWSFTSFIALVCLKNGLIGGVFAFQIYRYNPRNKMPLIVLSLGAFLTFVAGITLPIFFSWIQMRENFSSYSWLVYLELIINCALQCAIAFYSVQHTTAKQQKKMGIVFRNLLSTNIFSLICALTALVVVTGLHNIFVLFSVYGGLSEPVFLSWLASLHTAASSPEDYVDILADDLKPYSSEEKKPTILVDDEPTVDAADSDTQTAQRTASPAAAISKSRHKWSAVPVVRFHNLHEASLRNEALPRSSMLEPELGDNHDYFR